MKKTVKLIALLLVIVMMSTLLFGCSNKPTNANIEIASKEELDPAKIGDYGTLKLPIDKNGTTIEVLCVTSVTTDNDSVVVNELRRRTGLNIQIIAIPTSAVKEKAKVLVASRDQMPDMITPTGFTTAEINDLGDQGAFANILDYKDELPNFKKIYFDEAKERNIENDLKNFMDSKGRVFSFPIYDTNRDVNHGMLYRKDIFDKHNIKMWNDKESFLNTLRELKKAYPSSTPFASKTGINIIRDLGYSFGINGLNPYYNEDEGVWKYSCVDEKFKEVLDMLKIMYSEGLIDPEFLTATQAAWTSKMTQADKAFVTWDWIGRLDQFCEQTKGIVSGFDLRYAYPIGGKVITLAKTSTGPSIKKGKNELLALKLCDYLISESGAQLVSMGIEGVTYNLREDGKAEYIGFEGQKGIDVNTLESEYGLYISGIYKRFDRRSSYFDFTEREQEAQDMMNKKPGGGYMPSDPVLSFTPSEIDEYSKYTSGIAKAAEEFATKYILSDTYGEKEWNEWLNKAKSLGADIVIEQYNKAQERYNKL